MIEFPWAYQKIDPTTWAYMSSLLMLAVFFKFSRFWSIRNVDLFLIILLAPGLLLYQHGTNIEIQACKSLSQMGEPELLSLTSGGKLVRPTRKAKKRETIAPAQPSGDPNQPQSQDSTPQDSKPQKNTATDENQNNTDQIKPPSDQTNPTNPPGGPKNLTDQKSTADSPKSADNTGQVDNTGQANKTEQTGNAAPTDKTDQKNTPVQTKPHPKTAAEIEADRKLIEYWQERRVLGLTLLRSSFYFLLIVSGILLVRLLLDQLLVRKPLLGSNLSPGGMTFILCGLCFFLFANIIASQAKEKDILGAKTATKILGDNQQTNESQEQNVSNAELGPAYPLIHLLPVLSTVIHEQATSGTNTSGQGQEQKSESPKNSFIWVVKLMAIISQIAIVVGMVALGKFHFGSVETGISMATIYLLLPYTAQMTGRVDHVLPAALLLWAVILYRFPFWAGFLFGLVFGLVYYPVFLLALWLSFYWEKGALRFTYGVLVMFALLVLSLFLISTDQQPFWYNLQSTFGIRLPRVSGLKGIWELSWDPWFRLPFLVAFVSLCFSFVAWPPRKTLGTLMAYSAAAMVATQFWHGDGGGLYMAWYLPLTLATFFRPNLHQKIATSDVK